MAVTALALVSPLESGLLPGRLGEVLEASHAQAQDPPPSFTEGTPEPCPVNPFVWRPAGPGDGFGTDGSECIVKLPACPISPVRLGLMRLSAPAQHTIDAFEAEEAVLEAVLAAEHGATLPPLVEGALRRVEEAVNADAAPRPGWLPLEMTRYPEFCEDWAHDGIGIPDDPEVDEAGLYQRCRGLRGFVVTSVAATPGTVCRILTPIECPTFTAVGSDGTIRVAAHRTGSQSCAAVRRRAWTCEEGYLPANTFNSCYRPASDCSPDGSDEMLDLCWPDIHPACGSGAPEFPLGPSEDFRRARPNWTTTLNQLACAEYVGEDFLISPTERHCNSQQFLVPLRLGSSDHWCEYDSSQLRVECHLTRRPPDCKDARALCIKRASRTGGCDQIANTILCRALQAAFSQNTDTTLQDFQEASDRIRAVQEFLSVPAAVCNPCQQLPFSELPSRCNPCQQLPFSELPSRCTASQVGRPRSPLGALERVLAVKRDYPTSSSQCTAVTTTAEYNSNLACQRLPVCADPPKGRVAWASQHQSGLAIVNSAVEVSVLDVLDVLEQRRTPFVAFDVIRGDPSSPSIVFPGAYHYQHFTDATEAGSVSKATTLQLGDANQQFDLDSWPTDGSECTPRDRPYFDLIVEELWPDSADDHGEISSLFGSDSLDWWDDLRPQEKKDQTAARGLVWWADLDMDQRVARRADLTVQIQCVRNNYTVCDWTPSRSGYFKLTAAGAWRMTRSRGRAWQYSFTLGRRINEALENQVVRDKTERLIAQQGLTPKQVGIDPDSWEVRGLNPACGEDGAWQPADCPPIGTRSMLFDEDHAPTASCSDIDLRVRCGGGGDSNNYTETEPVGVIVHEVRVNTVMPSG